MTGILDQPVRVDREGERLYFYAPGEVCVDICSGRPEDRKRVMALLEQAQAMARILALDARVPCSFVPPCPSSGAEPETWCCECQARETLRKAGLR